LVLGIQPPASAVWLYSIGSVIDTDPIASMGLEQAAIYEMIAGAVDIIVHVVRDRTGQRKFRN